MSTFFILGLFALTLVLLYSVKQIYTLYTYWSGIKNSTIQPFSQVSYSDTPVAVKGTVKESSKQNILTSELFGKECVMYDYQIQKRTRNNSSNKNRWDTIDSGKEHRDFYLTDPNSENVAQINSEFVDFSVEEDIRSELPTEKQNEPESQNTLTVAVDALSSLASKSKRFREKSINIDEEILVYGTPHDSKETDILCEFGTNNSTALLSDTDLSSTVSRLRNKILKYVFVSIITVILISVFGFEVFSNHVFLLI